MRLVGSKPINSYVTRQKHFVHAFCIIANSWRPIVFYAQMTSCVMPFDVIYHPSPINSHYLNTSGVDSPAFVKYRIKSYTNRPFSSCWANEPWDLYQSKAWCTTIHANMSFINLRLNETFSSSSSSSFLYERTSTRSCFDEDYCRTWPAPGLGGILYWVRVIPRRNREPQTPILTAVHWSRDFLTFAVSGKCQHLRS